MRLCQVELVRQALQHLGEASPQELASFIEKQHGVRIETRIIPILRASVRGQEMLENARQAARAATQAKEAQAADVSSPVEMTKAAL